MWSGRQDSNLRPPGPKPGALARLCYAPKIVGFIAVNYHWIVNSVIDSLLNTL